MVRITRPPKKKKQESLARRLFAAGAAGVTMLTGGILGLRSAGAVKPSVAQVRLRTDLASGASRTPGAAGAAGITVAEEARIRAETERFLSELRRIDAESKQNRSFLARLLNIPPAQAEADESSLNATILALYNDNENPLALQNAVREVIASGAFTPDQAAAALQSAGIPPGAIQDIATNLGATPEQAAAYAAPAAPAMGGEEGGVFAPPLPASLPEAPTVPISPPVVGLGQPVLPVVPPVLPGAREEPAPPAERVVQAGGYQFIVTPDGHVLYYSDHSPTPYTVDSSGQVFQEGLPTSIGRIELQSPGIEEVPREVFVPTTPDAASTPVAERPTAPPGAPAPLGPPDWHVYPPAGGGIAIDAEGNFRVPDNPAVFGEFAGAYGHLDRTTLDYTFTNDQGQERRGNIRTEGWIIAAVAPATPAPPAVPTGTRVETAGQVFFVPPGAGFATAADNRPTKYYVEPERPGATGRVVRYDGPGGEPIGTVSGSVFTPRPEVATPLPAASTPAISEIRASSPRSFINSGENVGITSVFRLEKPVSSFEYRVDLPSGFTYVPGTAILRGVTVDVEPRIERRPDGGFTVSFILSGVPEGGSEFNFQIRSPEHAYGEQFAIPSSITAAGVRTEAEPVRVQTAVRPQNVSTDQVRPTVAPGGRELTLRINDALYTVRPDGTVVSPPTDQNQYFLVQSTDPQGNQQWDVRVGSREGQTAFTIDARGEMKTPRGESVGGFVAANVTVAEYVSGRADYYIRRATKDARDRGLDPATADAAIIRELVAKGIEPDKIAATTLKEWNNDALRVVRAAVGAGASAEAIREALSAKTVATPQGERDAFTVAVKQAVGEADQKAGAERIEGVGAIAGFLRQAGMSAGDAADKLKAAGFMDDPKAVLRAAGYSEDAVSTLARRVAASQVRIVHVEDRWFALYPDDRVLMPAGAKPASVTDDALYFSAADGRFFLGSSPLQEKSWNDVSDKQAFLLYQAKFQADGLDRSGAIAETFRRAIAAWGSNPARILTAANLAGLTNVEIVQGLDAVDQAARAAGSPTHYLEEGILAAIDLVRDQSAEVQETHKRAILTAIGDAALIRERLDELVQYLAPRLNMSEEQMNSIFSEFGIRRQTLRKAGLSRWYFAVRDEQGNPTQFYSFYQYPEQGSARGAPLLQAVRDRGLVLDRQPTSYTVYWPGTGNQFEIKLGNLVVGRVREIDSRTHESEYTPAYQTDTMSVARDAGTGRTVGRMRKAATGQLSFTGYQPLPYAGQTYLVPGPRDASGRGPAGAVMRSVAAGENPFTPYYVAGDGSVTDVHNRFFGQLTNVGFAPAFTINFHGQTYDINLANGEVYAVDGTRTGLVVVRAGATHEVHQGGPSGALLSTINSQTGEVRTPDGALAGTVGVGAVVEQPFISFGDYIRAKLGAGSGFQKQEFPGETMGESGTGGGGVSSPTLPQYPVFVNTPGEEGGGFTVQPGHPTYPYFSSNPPGVTVFPIAPITPVQPTDLSRIPGPTPASGAPSGPSFGVPNTVPLEPPFLPGVQLDPGAVATGVGPDFSSVSGVPISENGSFVPAASAGGAGAATPSLPAFDMSTMALNRPAPDLEAQLARFVEQGNANPQLTRDILESTPNAPEILKGIGAGERPVVPGTIKTTPAQAAEQTFTLVNSSGEQFVRPKAEFPSGVSFESPGLGRVVIPEHGGDVLQRLPDGRWQMIDVIAAEKQSLSGQARVLELQVGRSFEGSAVGSLLGSNVIVYGGGTNRSVAVIDPDGTYTETNDKNVVVVGSTIYTYANPPRLSPTERALGDQYGAIPTVPLRRNGQDTPSLVDALGNLYHHGISHVVSDATGLPIVPFALRPSGDASTLYFDSGTFVAPPGAIPPNPSNFGQPGMPPDPFDVVQPVAPIPATASRVGPIPFAFGINGNIYAASIRLDGYPSSVSAYGALSATGVGTPERTDLVMIRDGTLAKMDPRTGGVSAPLYEVRGFRMFEYGSNRQVGTVLSDQQFLQVVNPSARLARQGLIRIGYVNVAGTNYFFQLASPDAPSDWHADVGTTVAGGAVQGASGYRLTLGSLELPDGAHQVYLVHQGQNPNIAGFIDRSEEARPSFRGQFSTFVSSSAVLTVDGTIRDMTTGGIVHGVDEQSLIVGASISLGAPGQLPGASLFGPKAFFRTDGVEAGFTSIQLSDVAPFSVERLPSALQHGIPLPGAEVPLNVVGLTVTNIQNIQENIQVSMHVAANPSFETVSGRQVVRFDNLETRTFSSPSGLTIETGRGSFVYDLNSGDLTYVVPGGAPTTVLQPNFKLILALPEAERQGLVVAVNRGSFQLANASNVRRDLIQNQQAIQQLRGFAQQQNLDTSSPLAVQLIQNSDSFDALEASSGVEGGAELIAVSSRPILNSNQAANLVILAHEFGHYVNNTPADRAALGTFFQMASRGASDLSTFVAQVKQFVGPERRADVFAASVVSALVHANIWSREQGNQAIAGAMRHVAKLEGGLVDHSIDIHDPVDQRLANTQYALDFYLRHPEALNLGAVPTQTGGDILGGRPR